METDRNDDVRDGSSANRSLAIIRELQQLALIDDIGSDLDRAKSLMAKLKIMLFSDREISVLTNERWVLSSLRWICLLVILSEVIHLIYIVHPQILSTHSSGLGVSTTTPLSK